MYSRTLPLPTHGPSQRETTCRKQKKGIIARRSSNGRAHDDLGTLNFNLDFIPNKKKSNISPKLTGFHRTKTRHSRQKEPSSTDCLHQAGRGRAAGFHRCSRGQGFASFVGHTAAAWDRGSVWSCSLLDPAGPWGSAFCSNRMLAEDLESRGGTGQLWPSASVHQETAADGKASCRSACEKLDVENCCRSLRSPHRRRQSRNPNSRGVRWQSCKALEAMLAFRARRGWEHGRPPWHHQQRHQRHQQKPSQGPWGGGSPGASRRDG